ncbi:MAG: RagB/SusD family nutrient uptake outer membrane protein [Candidatus Pseudobacter hemicellulosilyticus]|uniref:RagB/SusD family nutrient uptake outer membrane protein n=1 Tax=Candidatus Pseudobacter hemicellulosilyticus TaxID=3121375 RepID=A0AAJ5WNY5_9BACT|nr:MAG: RagB/SusD family nutrient uptake outer membrane protein [Pseudobacter sp.]
MKTTYTSIIVLLLLTMNVSCRKYLETKQYGDILPETATDFSALLHGHLSSVDGASDRYILGSHTNVLDFESYCDNLNASLSTAFDLSPYVGTDINRLYYRFMNFYSNIKDYNIILDRFPSPSTDEEKKIVAVAHSMRAVAYFNLVREFCEPYETGGAAQQAGIPIVSSFNMEAKPARGNLRDAVQFIVDDLKAALAVGQTDELYRFTDDVAKAYLVRIYHWSQQWEAAIPLAKELLEKYPISTGQDYVSLMQTGPGPKSGSVIIRSYISGTLTSFTRVTTRMKTRPVSVDFVQLFTEKSRDIRYTFYFDNNLLNAKGAHNWIRSEEMCLALAESYAHTGNNEDALAYLNLLRGKRIADYTPYTLQTLPATNPKTLIQVDATGKSLTPLLSAILNERRKELYMEGDRWYEMKRNGRPEFWVGHNGIRYVTEKYLYTFPIRKGEMILNPLITQNEGYENM